MKWLFWGGLGVITYVYRGTILGYFQNGGHIIIPSGMPGGTPGPIPQSVFPPGTVPWPGPPAGYRVDPKTNIFYKPDGTMLVDANGNPTH